MSWLFGKSKTPQEIIREHQRTLQRSMRELERERVKLEQQEVKLKNDIKKAAKNNQIVRPAQPSRRFQGGRAPNPPASPLRALAAATERGQDHGQGHGADAAVHSKVPPDARPAPGRQLAHAGPRRGGARGAGLPPPWSHPFFVCGPGRFRGRRGRQTMRSTQSMADAMKGVAKAMRSMNRQINLPGIQKIMQDFERESEIMDMKEEMMNDAIDDAVDDENDEEETEAIVNQVLEEIGINLTQAVRLTRAGRATGGGACAHGGCARGATRRGVGNRRGRSRPPCRPRPRRPRRPGTTWTPRCGAAGATARGAVGGGLTRWQLAGKGDATRWGCAAPSTAGELAEMSGPHPLYM